MPAKHTAPEPPPLPPVVDALGRALAELDNLTARLAEAERGIPIAEDRARIADAAAEAGDVDHALGRLSAEERDRRHAEAKAAAEALAQARRMPSALRAAHGRAEEAVAALADDAAGQHSAWCRDRLAELGDEWRRLAEPLAALARLSFALRDAAGMLAPSDALRLPLDLPGDPLGHVHRLTGEGAARPASPALDAAHDAALLIQRARRIGDRLDRERPAA